MFELLYSSGLRVSELTSLDTHYCKADNGQPASQGWLEASFEVIVGKGSKMRRCLSARPPSWP
jgi:integrase/recombinase XerC